jgi:hypothetical protein
MSKARYSFENVGTDAFEFYEDGAFRLRFKRDSFRQVFEDFANTELRSSNWIGSVLRIFLKKFPPPFPVSQRNDSDRLLT